MNLDAIEQRTRAATEGPWEYDGRTLWGRDDIGRIKADTPEDRAFTTAARTDVPALVARVKELEEENARLRAGLDAATGFDFGDVEVRRHIDRWVVDSGPLELYDTLEAALERARENGDTP